VPTFAGVVNTTDPYGRILGFLDWPHIPSGFSFLWWSLKSQGFEKKTLGSIRVDPKTSKLPKQVMHSELGGFCDDEIKPPNSSDRAHLWNRILGVPALNLVMGLYATQNTIYSLFQRGCVQCSTSDTEAS
jgi:hypothetical protein